MTTPHTTKPAAYTTALVPSQPMIVLNKHHFAYNGLVNCTQKYLLTVIGTPASWSIRALYTHANSESDMMKKVIDNGKLVDGKCKSPNVGLSKKKLELTL